MFFQFYNRICFCLLEVTFGALFISKYNSKVILMWGYREKNGLAREGLFVNEIPT